MIEAVVLCEPSWPDADWDALSQQAVTATIAATPHAVLATTAATVEVSIRLSSNEEVHALNRQYRGQDKATNVLSFPMLQPDLIETVANTDDSEVLLGDIMLAFETCDREARARDVPLEAHASHLIVHGVLHLLGYDHMTDADADAMEDIEKTVMATLGLHDPYPVED